MDNWNEWKKSDDYVYEGSVDELVDQIRSYFELVPCDCKECKGDKYESS